VTRTVENYEITPSENFNIITNVDIKFYLLACTETLCTSALVTVSYPFNSHAPSFLLPSQDLSWDVSDCSSSSPCTLEADNLQALDGDGDTLIYSILRTVSHSELFAISDPLVPSVQFLGGDLADNSSVTLIMLARDTGHPSSLTGQTVLNLEMVTANQNPAPPDDEEEKSKENLYFWLMIGFASGLGALLLLLLIIALCFCCCRGSSSVGIAKSSQPSVKNAGIYTTGASYKSYSEMNYVTLQEVHSSESIGSSNSSESSGSPHLNSATGRVRSRPKSSKRALPQEYTTKARDSNI